MKKIQMIKTAGKAALIGVFLAVSFYLLKDDAASFLRWWLAVLVLGAVGYPLVSLLFPGFRDRGWLVAKVLGIAVTGYVVWAGTVAGVWGFSAGTVRVLVGSLGVAALAAGLWIRKRRMKAVTLQRETLAAILDEELVFTFFFLLWTYLAGFHPAAHGTEKFMDFGFMKTMMRSTQLPAPDLWYGGETVNYYYGGQYFAVFLTKLTGTQVEQTYHLMRTLVAGFAFALPFSLVRQMVWDAGKKGAAFGGILAGAGVSLAGNMHYVVVGKLLPLIRKLLHLPEGDYTYWFPNSTRYIGYYPAENDKTIHEFPSYSFVLGDLHAHVVNVMFVLALICLVYALIQNSRKQRRGKERKLRRMLGNPHVWLLGFFIGMFHWTNYWDFAIYYVMGGMGVIYANDLDTASERTGETERLSDRIRKTAQISLVHAVLVFAVGTIAAIPFTSRFQAMVHGIALAQNHSRPYQWWLIWGLPVLFSLVFFLTLLQEVGKNRKQLLPADGFGVILGVSALGLILIPELVYVRDIYEKEFARSNTMFKLTYQAFILFGLLMGYGFVRLWQKKKDLLRKCILAAGFLCFLGCCGYFGTAVRSWFGPVWNPGFYQGLNATAYLETKYPEDAAAIRWLDAQVEGTPVVLEANGDSYSEYCRVSAMTGLPTVLGWYVHEWLWRDGVEGLNQRSMEVEMIYTSADRTEVEELLDTYAVEYIFIGKMEHEKYTDLNTTLLKSLGKVVYEDPTGNTCIIRRTPNV